MEQPVKYLAVTKADAELLLDSFKCRAPETRAMALRVAGIVLEFASDEGVREADRLMAIDRALLAERAQDGTQP